MNKMTNAIGALAAVGLLASSALAGPSGPSYRLLMGGSVPGNTGGAFTVTPKVGGSGNWSSLGYQIDSPFKTFCVESVTFNPGTTYWASIDKEVYNGGTAPLTLTSGTKNVFARFTTGGTFGAFGQIDTADEHTVLQAYIWLEEEVFANVNALPAAQKSAWNANLGAGGLVEAIQAAGNTAHVRADSVRVLNLWSNWSAEGGFSGDVQTQLLLVPLPGAVLLGAVGLGGVAWIKRRQLA